MLTHVVVAAGNDGTLYSVTIHGNSIVNAKMSGQLNALFRSDIPIEAATEIALSELRKDGDVLKVLRLHRGTSEFNTLREAIASEAIPDDDLSALIHDPRILTKIKIAKKVKKLVKRGAPAVVAIRSGGE